MWRIDITNSITSVTESIHAIYAWHRRLLRGLTTRYQFILMIFIALVMLGCSLLLEAFLLFHNLFRCNLHFTRLIIIFILHTRPMSFKARLPFRPSLRLCFTISFWWVKTSLFIIHLLNLIINIISYTFITYCNKSI